MSMDIVLFSPDSQEQFEKVFPSRHGKISAFARSLLWAQKISASEPDSRITVLCYEHNRAPAEAEPFFNDAELVSSENWNTALLMQTISSRAKEDERNFIVYANASAAFLDAALTEKLIQTHTEYKAEYTFSDGYPCGFAPEILDTGAALIISELSRTSAKTQGEAPVTKDSVFEVIKADINSFEIETEISDFDYRLLRLNFLCDCRLNFLSAKNLAERVVELGKEALLDTGCETAGAENVTALSDIAMECENVLKTVPAFYNVQINCSSKNIPPFTPYADFFKARYGEDILSTQKRMEFSQFEGLVKEIRTLSGEAVVSLSLWGEAVLHPELFQFAELLLKNGLTPILEIDGSAVSGFLKTAGYKALKALSEESRRKIIFIAALDAFTENTFSALHGTSCSLGEAVEAVKSLAADFSRVCVQFTRTTQNEEELEAFYRAYSSPEGITGGKLIVQKYDNFCGVLPSVKTADLAPVVREPCWHLRRDMEILFDGSVPLCREVCVPSCRESGFLGNVFETSLSELWQKKNTVLKEHIQKNYCGACGKCDEYYIFNF